MRRLSFKLLVLGLASLFGFAIAELGARILLADVTTTADNTSYFARRWERRSPPVLNALGYRGPELDSDSTRVRVAVIGDSITYGQGLPVGDRFTDLLGGLLNEVNPNQPYEVLNFGRPGAETVDHIEIFDRDVRPVQPELIVLQWYVNDVEGDQHAERPRPLRLLPSDRVVSWLHRRSAIFYIANQNWVRAQHGLGLTETYPDYLKRRFGDARSAASREAQEALRGFFASAARSGIPVGAIFFPGAWEEASSENGTGFLLERALQVCREVARFCVDLREPIFEMPFADRRVNSLDAHPSAEINRIAAERLAEEISRLL